MILASNMQAHLLLCTPFLTGLDPQWVVAQRLGASALKYPPALIKKLLSILTEQETRTAPVSKLLRPQINPWTFVLLTW